MSNFTFNHGINLLFIFFLNYGVESFEVVTLVNSDSLKMKRRTSWLVVQSVCTMLLTVQIIAVRLLSSKVCSIWEKIT